MQRVVVAAAAVLAAIALPAGARGTRRAALPRLRALPV